jgi:hypothetical protein
MTSFKLGSFAPRSKGAKTQRLILNVFRGLAMLKSKFAIFYTIPLLFIFSVIVGKVCPSFASEADNIPLPSTAPLELNLLTQPHDSVITANTISPVGLTVPSLWWIQETSEKKLLDNWLAYQASDQEPARVDLIVNQQIWSLLDYLERYEFVNRVGSTARNFGYNIRVFNYQREALGTYTCNFQTVPALCKINMKL